VAVQGQRQLEHYQRPASDAVMDKGGIDPASGTLERPESHFHAGRSQGGEPTALDSVIGILHRNYGTPDPGGDQGLRAGRPSAKEAARLERDIDRRPSRIQPCQRNRFRVGGSRPTMHSPADRFAVTHDDSSDTGVGRRGWHTAGKG
jgi:hypothetical protein